MHETVQKLNSIKDKAKEVLAKTQLKTNPQIIAVTKTFPLNKISPLIESGHIHFGENKFKKLKLNGIILETIIKI